MLEELLTQEEGKTLEFKENTHSLGGIVKTIVAFANTAGGILVIGVKNRTKEIIGLADVLKEEEKVANAIADSVFPLLVPDIEMHTYREKEILILRVPHAAGPFYIKAEGEKHGTYIRFGSTNRIVDEEMLTSLRLFAANLSFDETPQPKGKIDWDKIEEAFKRVEKKPNEKTCEALGITSSSSGKNFPTGGGVLLFGINHLVLFPDSIIRCARFKGGTKETILDHRDIGLNLSFAIQEIIHFIEKNARIEGRIGKIQRKDIAEYPPLAIREAVINALLHSDYSMKGCHIQIAVFDDRIEFTNPGGLPFGQTLQKALAGFSRLRNHVIGRVFRELKLIEQWGSGLQKIFAACKKQKLKAPQIEELNNQFRLTIFSIQERAGMAVVQAWEEELVSYLKQMKSITTKKAAKLWNVTDRTARSRLKTMMTEGTIQRIGTSEKDPRAIFILRARQR